MIKGFDISHNNDPINWDKLSPQIQFCYCKATQGGTFKDPMFQTYWQALKAKGIMHGAYHFLNTKYTAQAQADNFLSRGINFSLPGVLPPALDIEDQIGNTPAETVVLNKWILNNKQQFIQLATDWLNIISKATGRVPVIYSYKNFFEEYLNNHSWPNPLWLSAFQATPPGLPKGWDKFTFWQNSQYGKFTGELTGGGFDMDLFNGTINDLKKL